MPSRTGEPDIALSRVATEDIDKAWPDVEPLLRMGCERLPSFHTPDSLHQRLLDEKCTLWIIYRRGEPLPLLAAAVSSAIGDVALIEVLGGKHMAAWKTETLAKFEVMAKANGMREITINGREGWFRELPGYRKVSIELRKTL